MKTLPGWLNGINWIILVLGGIGVLVKLPGILESSVLRAVGAVLPIAILGFTLAYDARRIHKLRIAVFVGNFAASALFIVAALASISFGPLVALPSLLFVVVFGANAGYIFRNKNVEMAPEPEVRTDSGHGWGK